MKDEAPKDATLHSNSSMASWSESQITKSSLRIFSSIILYACLMMNVPCIESASENQYFSNWNSIGLYWSGLLNQKEKALIGRCQTALSPVMTQYQFWLYTDKSSRKLDVRFLSSGFPPRELFSSPSPVDLWPLPVNYKVQPCQKWEDVSAGINDGKEIYEIEKSWSHLFACPWPVICFSESYVMFGGNVRWIIVIIN